MKPIDVNPHDLGIVLDVLRKYVPDREILAFGSRVTWTAKEFSDLDLAIMGDQPLSSTTLTALKDELDESDVPFKVDVVDWATTSESFRDVIRRDGVRIRCSELAGTGTAGQRRQTTIGAQATLQRGIDITKAEQRPGKIPVISSGGVSSYHDTAHVRGPGVVLGRKGVVGSVYYINSDYWPHDTTLWVKDFHGNDPRFVYYFFRQMAPRLATMDVGSANPTLNRNHVHPIEVLWPPLPEQRAIAHILGTLDDKIELNRRMNETLEAIARALFKSWFVDFDPVRAKAEGRDPTLPRPIADLFPDRFVDSELGEVPAGWMIGTLSDVAIHPRRGVQPIEIDPSTPYIALEHMPKRCIALADWGTADRVESNKFQFKKGQILFGKLRPYFHKVGIAPVDGVCSTDILVVASRTDKWLAFVLGHVSSTALVDYTNAGSTGTKMPRTSWSEMARYPIVMPPENVAEVFNTQIHLVVDRIIADILESHTLTALRDALLPKLISGELRVPDAEAIAARSA